MIKIDKINNNQYISYKNIFHKPITSLSLYGPPNETKKMRLHVNVYSDVNLNICKLQYGNVIVTNLHLSYTCMSF